MESVAQVIEWIFSSPFIWMALLGIVTAHSLRKHAVNVSMPYAPLIEEKTKNNMGGRMILSFSLGTASALLLYFTDSDLSFSYELGIWFAAFIVIANNKESLAFLVAALVVGTVCLSQYGVQEAYKVIRFAGAYQMVMGALYLIGKKETYPVMQQQKDGSVTGEHLFKEIWLLPAFAVTTEAYSDLTFGFILLVMLLVCEVRIRCMVPEKYFKKHGTFMAASGILLFALSFAINEIVFYATLFGIIPAVIIYWFVKEKMFYNKNECIYIAKELGVQVFYVYEETPASVMQLKTGDLITEINGRRVVTYEAIDSFLEDRPPFVWVKVKRGEKEFEAEYKDYREGVFDLGFVHTPKNPSKFETYPRTGFVMRTLAKLGIRKVK